MATFVPLRYSLPLPAALTDLASAASLDALLDDIGLVSIVTGETDALAFELDATIAVRSAIELAVPAVPGVQLRLFAGVDATQLNQFSVGGGWRRAGGVEITADLPIELRLAIPEFSPAIVDADGPRPDPTRSDLAVQLTATVRYATDAGVSADIPGGLNLPPMLLGASGCALELHGLTLQANPFALGIGSATLHLPRSLHAIARQVGVRDARLTQAPGGWRVAGALVAADADGWLLAVPGCDGFGVVLRELAQLEVVVGSSGHARLELGAFTIRLPPQSFRFVRSTGGKPDKDAAGAWIEQDRRVELDVAWPAAGGAARQFPLSVDVDAAGHFAVSTLDTTAMPLPAVSLPPTLLTGFGVVVSVESLALTLSRASLGASVAAVQLFLPDSLMGGVPAPDLALIDLHLAVRRATPDADLLLPRTDGGGLVVEASGRARIGIPLEILAGVDGGRLEAEGGLAVLYPIGAQPQLTLQAFTLSATDVSVGGPGGLIVKNASLTLGAVQLPLAAPSPARPLPFDLAVRGTLSLPGNSATLEVDASYQGGTWRIASSGTVQLDNGVELLPVQGKPVLELDAQPGAGAYRFAAAGAIKVPQEGAAGGAQLALSGSLAIRVASGTLQVETFEMSASATNWALSADVQLRTLSVSLGYRADRFTATLAAVIPFSDGFELALLDAIPVDLAAGTTLQPGLVIQRSGDRLDFDVTCGVRLQVPMNVISAGDGDQPVVAEACGRFAFSTDASVLPSLSGVSLALRAERLHLGGAGGLIVEQAALVATSVDRFLALGTAPHPTLTFSGKVICPVTAPDGEVALSLRGARFTFEYADQLPGFEFADGGALGFEAADLGGLPLEITQGEVRLRQGGALPGVLHPDNLIVSLGARLKLAFAGSAAVMAEIDKVTVEIKHGQPCLTLDGASAGVDNLSLGVMKMSGALGLHNLQDPLDIQLEGTLGGTMYGSGVKALVAIKLENGLPRPLGVCLDVSAGPSGIPLLYGFVIVGAAGGISFANTNADPCDFRTYTRSARPISSGRTLASKRPEPFPGCPCECPPPALNILCQPHPDQDAYAGRVILKFSAIDEALWSSIPLAGGTTLGARVHQLDQEIGDRLAAAAASFDPHVEAQRAADAVVDGAVAAMRAIIPALDPGNVRPLPPPELRAQFDRLAPILQAPASYWAEQMRALLATELATALVSAKSGAATGRPQIYDLIKQELYRGVSCPDETLQVTGTFSYTGVSMFLSVTGGVNVSTAGSMGVIGYLNVLSIPIGQLRAFVTVTSDVGDPEPSLCGDLRFELGPLYLGQLSLSYRVPGCVTNLAATVVKFGARLGAPILARVLSRIERAGQAFAARAGYDPSRPETALATLTPPEASQLVAQLLSDLSRLSPADAVLTARFLGDLAGDLWDGFRPRIELCGRVAPTLFGLPLGGELVQATGVIEKDHLEVQFGFSPMYLLGRVCPVADMFSGMDAARMGAAMTLPTVEQLIIDGLTGQFASQDQFERYLDQGLARLLRDAVFTFSYQFFPLGMKLVDGQGRAVMPYLTPHPASTASTWRSPDGVAGAAAPPRRRQVLFAALDRGKLADVHWTGAIGDVMELPAAQHDLQLQRDYFPHGGLLGAGKLQVPRLLWDAPPLELLGRLVSGRSWLDRLKALIELVRDWVLATREAGTLAFYLPAPNPPGPLRDAPGDNLRKLIDSLVQLDLQRLMPTGSVAAGDLYALELAFFEGFLHGRLLGVDIGTADLTFVPPSAAGGASELRAAARVSADPRLRAWVAEAPLDLRVANPPADRVLAPLDRQPIDPLFTALLVRAQAASAAIVPGGHGVVGPVVVGPGGRPEPGPPPAVPPAVTALLDEAIHALAERLPKVSVSAAVALQVPAELAAFLDAPAAGGAELRAYSPCYDPAAQGTTPDANARRNGGLILAGDLRFQLGPLWAFTAKAQLAVTLPVDHAQRARVAGRVDVGVVSGLRFLELALPLRNAWLAIDSDPAAGQPVLSLHGELSVLGAGPLQLEPLSGPLLSVAVNAARSPGGAAISLAMSGARVRLPCVAAETPLELRPLPGQHEITLASAGGAAALAAPSGLTLLAPGNVVVLHVAGPGSGSVQIAADGTAALAVSLPVGLQGSLFPGDAVLHRDFQLAQAIDVQLRSDGTFRGSVRLPPLVLANGLFTLHGAAGITDPISVVATQHAVELAAPARLTLQVPGAAAQTAVLETLTLGVDGSLAATGSTVALQLPGLATCTAGGFALLRRGASVRFRITDAQLTFTALPGLVARWNVELGNNFFSAKLAVSATLACHFGTRLTIESAQWSVQAASLQSLTVTAASPRMTLFGTFAISAGAAAAITLASGTLSAQLAVAGTVPMIPGLLELGLQRIRITGGASASVELAGQMRALRQNDTWLADAPITAKLDADTFETAALVGNGSLFDHNGLAIRADLGFGHDAGGFYLACKPLRVSYLGVTLFSGNRTLRANAAVTAAWSEATIPLPPFALTVPSGSLSLDPAAQTATLSLAAGQLAATHTSWPALTFATPALQCSWARGEPTPNSASATLAGRDSDWQRDVPGVQYRFTTPSLRASLALGSGAPSRVLAGVTLTGARLEIQTTALRPDNKQPWAAVRKSLGDIAIGLDGKVTLALPAFAPDAPDPLKDLRNACETTARHDHKLPDVPSAPSGPRPRWEPARSTYDDLMRAYNDAVSALNKAKNELQSALDNCATRYPSPPGEASFHGATTMVGLKQWFFTP